MRRYILYECGDNIRSNVGSKTEREQDEITETIEEIKNTVYGMFHSDT